ncbi:15648_t:CDS:2 [Entrophospora sp. SA101]|nr:15648_t:CDS:2 [Entrophospora sp. SA101]
MSSLGKATHLWNYRFRFSSITDDDDNNDDETVDLLSKTYIDRSHDVYQDEIIITHAKDMNVAFDKLFNLAPLPEEISKVSDLNKTDFKLKKKNSFNDFNNNNVDGYQSKKRSMSTASEPCRMTRYASISSNKQKKDSYLGTSESYVISELSHPMCQEYTEMLLDSLGKQLTDTSKERDCYKDFLKKMNGKLAATDMLKDIEHEREVLKKELEKLEAETSQLDELEENYWKEFNNFHIQLQSFQNDRDSINLKYDHDTKLLEKLHRTNVYNDTFCIGHDGYFGTINGFRLGRLPKIPVEWNEINAAWGQTALLLSIIAKRLKFTFQKYGTGDIAIGRLFQNRRFDSAMVGFLNCLQQLGEYVESEDPKLNLPYRINKDKINDASIRLQFSVEEWTRALKYTLAYLKWILAYASSIKNGSGKN